MTKVRFLGGCYVSISADFDLSKNTEDRLSAVFNKTVNTSIKKSDVLLRHWNNGDFQAKQFVWYHTARILANEYNKLENRMYTIIVEREV